MRMCIQIITYAHMYKDNEICLAIKIMKYAYVYTNNEICVKIMNIQEYLIIYIHNDNY